MAYDLLTRRTNKANASRIPMRDIAASAMGAELTLSKEDREALLNAGQRVRTAGTLVLVGLVIVGIAEIVGHRNMSFKGDGSFLHHYKTGRGVKQS